MRANPQVIVVLLLAGLAQFGRAQQTPGGDEVQLLPVQGNVYMLSGAGGNIVIQSGDQGTLIVDTGREGTSEKVLAALRKLTPKPIQYILDTSGDPDHAGGNAALRKAGATYTGANVTSEIADAELGAQVFAHNNVLMRMSAPTGKQSPVETGEWPTQTFLEESKQMSFDGEPVEMFHQPAAHSDGDCIVFFRHSDVIAAGEVFLTTSYPNIDLERGGSIQGEIDALNNIIDLAVPLRQEEGGTYIVPGHGRIADRFEVVEYRDMVTIVRDRIRAAIKAGMTLEQIRKADLTLDYDYRYGAKSGFGTADNFVASVYNSLMKTK